MSFLLSGQLLFAAILAGTSYAAIGLGLNLVYGTMRLLNIAHGDVLMLGAYVAFVGFTQFGLSPLLAAPIAGALAAAFGATLYYGLLQKFMRDRRAEKRMEANSLLIFVGIAVILENVSTLIFTGTPRGYQYLDQVYHLGEVTVTANRLVAFAATAAICIGVLAFLKLSITGLAIKALIQRRDAAIIVGVDVNRLQLMSLCLGFGVAGILGALVSMTEQVSPFMGFPFTITAFVVVILGGLGNLAGGMLAGMAFGFLQTYGVALTSSAWASILLYGFFVAALVLRPEGLLARRAGAR